MSFVFVSGDQQKRNFRLIGLESSRALCNEDSELNPSFSKVFTSDSSRTKNCNRVITSLSFMLKYYPNVNGNTDFQVKTLKEQLKSKQLHMELLRKKIAQFEEKEQTRSALALDRDDAIVTVQRLHRKVERLQHALGDERVKVTQLKAQLAETNQLKVSVVSLRTKYC